MRRKKPYDGPLINIDPELVFNTIEAGRLLGVSDREVRAKISRGTLPAVKIGNKYHINRKAIFVYEHICKMKNRSRKEALRPARADCSQYSDLVSPVVPVNNRPYLVLFDRDYPHTVSIFQHTFRVNTRIFN